VYEDKIYIWNDGEMPEELDSTDKLFLKHASKPYNPKLANVFFKSGMIEAWGRGFEKIKEACALYEGPLPEYEISVSGIMVLCKACDRYMSLLKNDGQHHGHGDQESDHDNEHDIKKQIIEFCREPKSASEIMQKLKLERSYFRRHYLDKMLASGELQRTEPNKPKSKNQKYYS
jgi:ATP-dependent DNA helicase RecG